MSFLNNPNVNSFTINSSNFKTLLERFVATKDQKVFTLANTYEIGLNRLEVTVDGIEQFSPTNFAETSPNSISFLEGLPLGVKVDIKIIQIG